MVAVFENPSAAGHSLRLFSSHGSMAEAFGDVDVFGT